MNFKVTTHLFYKLGSWCFGIMAIMNTITFSQTYQNDIMITVTISRLASLLFSYLLFGFFVYLYRQLPPANQVEMSEEEWNDLLSPKKK